MNFLTAYYHYTRLKCEIEPLPLDGKEAKLVTAYLSNTHGGTHSYLKLEVQQVLKIARENEDSRFEPFAGVKNRMLLWHGSRLCNWTGILSQGLRIAPPEAPVSGYMFGKVALGDMRELLNGDYHADQLPPGKLSTKGVGTEAPDPKGTMVCPDGLVVPGAYLRYNEYIVYNTAQIRMKSQHR